MNTQEYVGEIIESSTTEFISETRELHQSPPFGAFVHVDSDPRIFGVVYNVCTHSIEPNRRPTAYGKTEEELRFEQPQIFELLRTEFQALVLGYRDGAGPRQFLPPQPPRIHSFVYECTKREVRDFTSSWDFLRAILNAPKAPVDEIMVATIRNAYGAHRENFRYLVRTGKELSRLMRSDYDRLSSIVRRIQE